MWVIPFVPGSICSGKNGNSHSQNYFFLKIAVGCYHGSTVSLHTPESDINDTQRNLQLNEVTQKAMMKKIRNRREGEERNEDLFALHTYLS